MLHLIRVRLRAKDPELYVKLGNPAFDDSNLGPMIRAIPGETWESGRAVQAASRVCRRSILQ